MGDGEVNDGDGVALKGRGEGEAAVRVGVGLERGACRYNNKINLY